MEHPVTPIAARWSMSPSDVLEYEGASTSFSEGGSLTSRTLTFHHVPTLLEVSGQVPPGHYTKKEMTSMLQQLRARLWPELEEAVADKLGVSPSRSL